MAKWFLRRKKVKPKAKVRIEIEILIGDIIVGIERLV
jgi:hypothetical protein